MTIHEWSIPTTSGVIKVAATTANEALELASRGGYEITAGEITCQEAKAIGYTPGPWSFDTQGRGDFGVNSNGKPWKAVAEVKENSLGAGTVSEEEAHANARLIEKAPELLESLTVREWLVWSNYHKAWWGPNRCDYVWEVENAGRYSLAEAQEIASFRQVERGPGINPPEMIQPSPELLGKWAQAIQRATGKFG